MGRLGPGADQGRGSLCPQIYASGAPRHLPESDMADRGRKPKRRCAAQVAPLVLGVAGGAEEAASYERNMYLVRLASARADITTSNLFLPQSSASTLSVNVRRRGEQFPCRHRNRSRYPRPDERSNQSLAAFHADDLEGGVQLARGVEVRFDRRLLHFADMVDKESAGGLHRQLLAMSSNNRKPLPAQSVKVRSECPPRRKLVAPPSSLRTQKAGFYDVGRDCRGSPKGSFLCPRGVYSARSRCLSWLILPIRSFARVRWHRPTIPQATLIQ